MRVNIKITRPIIVSISRLWVRTQGTSERTDVSIDYVTIIWGAEKSTAIVAMTVNSVKIMRHSLSTTMAANFQSFVTSAASSSFRSLSVITRSSFSISVSSLWGPRQECNTPPPSSCPLRNVWLEDCSDCSVPWRKSSSMSRTFANRLLEERSFSSSSLSCKDFRLSDVSLPPLPPPGRLILSKHGNQCRNSDFICTLITQY